MVSIGDDVSHQQVNAMFEAMLLQPLFAPLEESMGPVASTAFSSMLAQLLERNGA
jgi:hypothetical protein